MTLDDVCTAAGALATAISDPDAGLGDVTVGILLMVGLLHRMAAGQEPPEHLMTLVHEALAHLEAQAAVRGIQMTVQGEL